MMRQTVDDVVVTKLPSHARAADLAARLRAASTDPIRALFAAPLTPEPIPAPDGRLLVLEPRTDAAATTEPVPWREIGALIGRLQSAPIPREYPIPEHGGRAALTASVAIADALHPGGSTDILRELGRALLRTWPTASNPVLVHGRISLNAIGRAAQAPSWLFTQPGTLGFGTPTYDLGVPAGMWAAGLLDLASWQACLQGYREAGGTTPAGHEVWPALDHPARCAVYLATVREVAASGEHPAIQLAPRTQALVETCVRINGRSGGQGRPDHAFGWVRPESNPTPDAQGLLNL